MKREDLLWTLSGVSFAHGYLASNVFSALFGLGLALYILNARKFEPKLEVKVDFPESAEEGKRTKAVVKVKNHGSDVKIKFKCSNPAIKVENDGKLILKAGEEKFIELSLTPRKRGDHEVSLGLEVYDPNELYFEEIDLGRKKLSVVPSVNSIREAAKEDYNLRLGEIYRKSIFLGMETIELEGLREYLPGDDFRRIDWKATSRIGELIVRVFMKEWEGNVYLVLDSTREMRKGLRKAKIDYASTLVLHLATVLLKKNYTVGLIVYTENNVRIVRPSKGREQLNRIRNAVKFKPERGLKSLKSDLGIEFTGKGRRFMEKIFPRKRRGPSEALLGIKEPSYLILITDLMGHTSLLYRLTLMLRKKHRMIILSPNPVLFYDGELDKETLRILYRRYLEREETVKKFNTIVPTIDLGPGDYLREIMKELEMGR
ncbi:hypothetical protein A3L12_02825 [Thermococcus sp. P6]|uniref:DUF58 domain-containing protein n=1 Tax=Thermococcus sp. P6 TaxID=122420 RepID=UPI000B59C824|nr:DUF58 domain-containing protein [Thermococcus sp. P6]ASJ10303.1 hypothetical protein A3L12_02825 [Thermococcus sp. P6]